MSDLRKIRLRNINTNSNHGSIGLNLLKRMQNNEGWIMYFRSGRVSQFEVP